MTRQTCNFKHPTILHIQRSQSQLQMLLHLIMHHRDQSLKRGPVRRISSALVSLGEGEGTGSGKDCILAITPVQVKLRVEVKVYLPMPSWTRVVQTHFVQRTQ